MIITQEWYQDNREYKLKKNAEWYKNNPNKSVEYQRKYRDNNIELTNKRSLDWYHKNKEKISARRKAKRLALKNR